MHASGFEQVAGEVDRIATRVTGTRTPALSYAVAATNRLIAAGAVGVSDLRQERPATAADQFPWFSMTKVATATALVVLARRGDVDLDMPIGAYLPGYVGGKHGEPTTRQLLTHTAGLGNPIPVRWIRPVGQPPDTALVAAVLRKHGPPRRPPGGRAAYSNIGYLLAGQVVERVTGRCVDEAVTDLVLRPLALQDTGYDYDLVRPSATGYIRAPRAAQPVLRGLLPRGVVGERVGGYTSLQPFLVEGAAYGGLVGTARDAVRLAAAHLPGSGSPLGDLGAMQQITCPGRPFDHGVGWFRQSVDADRSPPFVEHYGTGGGFWNAMRIYPTLGVAIVGMTNSTHSWPYDDFFSAVARLCTGEATLGSSAVPPGSPDKKTCGAGTDLV